MDTNNIIGRRTCKDKGILYASSGEPLFVIKRYLNTTGKTILQKKCVLISYRQRKMTTRSQPRIMVMSTTMLTILTYRMKWKTKTKMRTSKSYNMVPIILILTKKMTKTRTMIHLKVYLIQNLPT